MSPAARGRTSTLVDVSLADAMIERRLRAVADPRAAMTQIGEVIEDEYAVQYRTGRGWRAGSRQWAQRKAAAGRGSRLLVYRGILERSLTVKGARYAKRKVTRDLVEVRSTDPVGNILRRGTSRIRPIDPGQLNRQALTRRARRVMLTAIAEDAFRRGS